MTSGSDGGAAQVAAQQPGATSGGGSGLANQPPVDAERVADRVYRLLMQDLRLERARTGRGPREG
jgi:hypothetical protein